MSGTDPIRGEASNRAKASNGAKTPNRAKTSNRTRISFGTSGWRGIIGDDFTVGNFSIVVQAIADYLKRAEEIGSGIIVGYDTRFMSDRFAGIASDIFSRNNIPVFLTNRDTPTPAIALHILRRHTLGAINVTASHNPPHYNGIKFSTSYGGPAPKEVTEEIEKIIQHARGHTEDVQGLTLNKTGSDLLKKKWEKKWGLTPFLPKIFDPRPVYIRHICSMIDLDAIKKSMIKIAIDCMYGTVRGYLDYILKDAMVLHNTLDPNFGGLAPDPSREHLIELRGRVIKSRAHIGLSTDGDGDRFGIIDRDGSFIPTNYILALIFEHLLKTRPHKGGVVRSIPTTHLLDAIARKFGREIFEVPVGFKYVGSTLLEKDAIMGCEESGGMTIFGHVPEKDGILACLLVAEIIAYNKKSLKELLKEIGDRYGRFYSRRIDLRLTQGDKESFLSKLRNSSSYKHLPGDNFKRDLADGSWIMIRPSGTEPIVRCYVESPSFKKIPALVSEIKRWSQR